MITAPNLGDSGRRVRFAMAKVEGSNPFIRFSEVRPTMVAKVGFEIAELQAARLIVSASACNRSHPV